MQGHYVCLVRGIQTLQAPDAMMLLVVFVHARNLSNMVVPLRFGESPSDDPALHLKAPVIWLKAQKDWTPFDNQ